MLGARNQVISAACSSSPAIQARMVADMPCGASGSKNRFPPSSPASDMWICEEFPARS